MSGADTTRCPETIAGSGGKRLRCQSEAGHEGQCAYHRRGSQGGTLATWWGANPRPVGWTGDLSWGQLQAEVARLRDLCDANGVEWRS